MGERVLEERGCREHWSSPAGAGAGAFKGERWIRLTRWPAEMFDLYPQWWAVVICLDGNLRSTELSKP